MGYTRVPRFERVWSANDWLRMLMELGVPAARAEAWAEPFEGEVQPGRFSQGMDDVHAWLPQVLHETGMLRSLKENLDYSAERIREVAAMVGPGRWAEAAKRAEQLAHNPDALAEAVYGGRMGNDMPGDGARFPGRGLIMATGRGAYRRLGDRMGQDLEGNPTLLEQKRYAIEAAIYWWEGDIPDLTLSDQVKIRRRVNGGTIGLKHCLQLHENVCKVVVA
jgi:putative chitinase